MAWNEPGGNKNKDPWGNRGGNGGNDGPPDLDEVFKKFMGKLNGVLGGSGGGSNRGASSGNNSAGIIALVAIAAVIWLLTGTYKIAEAERGVVLTFGKHSYTVESGLHWHFPAPIQKVLKVDVSNIHEYSHNGTMLTQDQNIIDIEITIQYQIGSAENYFFNMRSPVRTLAEASESALRQHVGRSTMDYVFGDGREDIAVSTQETTQQILDSYKSGLLIVRVNMQEAKPPEAVKASFDDVTKAVEDEDKLQNQAEAYRNEILPTARGEAAKMLEQAKAYKQEVVARADGDAQRFTSLYNEYRKAPGVTRDRMYIETVESVLSQSSKIMVDVEGGNNMIYLPLDKMLENTGTARNTVRNASGLMDNPRDSDFDIDLRNRSTRTREAR
ncbi:MAG: FtsH protease activity modulator HflK [Gammaproteobacteria bacterium]|nr:FtsH protease activity modulator HflK [Gammaproteobacteria bacterium]